MVCRMIQSKVNVRVTEFRNFAKMTDFKVYLLRWYACNQKTILMVNYYYYYY